MKRFLLFTKALALIHLRNRTILFWNTVFPILLLFLYGFIFNNGAVDGVSYITWVLPGVLILNALSFGLITSSSVMLALRENGILRRLQATPMPALQLVVGYLLVNVIIALTQSILIGVTAVLVFQVNVTAVGILRAAPMVLAGIITFVALGQIISGVAQSGTVANMAGQLLYFSLMFVTDMIIPIGILPTWFQKVATYLPSYAVVQLVRPPLLAGIWGENLSINLLLTTLYALAAILIAARLFRWEPRS